MHFKQSIVVEIAFLDPSIDDVYLAVALARRCSVLDQLNQPARRADARRQLLSIYEGLSEEKKMMVGSTLNAK